MLVAADKGDPAERHKDVARRAILAQLPGGGPGGWLSLWRRRAWRQRCKRFFDECQRRHDLWLSNVTHHVWQRWRNVSAVFCGRSRWWRDSSQCERYFAGGWTHHGQRRQWFRVRRRRRGRRQHLVDIWNSDWLRLHHGQLREWGWFDRAARPPTAPLPLT